ncbi:MAG: HU family DNA-binding protein [Hydrococcus sp. C42_A2020_068]|jgi:nucleoid DNA-binding protein|nr:HU family DNA-binding protein [Hydrococcus sp. C42_A2020_068]
MSLNKKAMVRAIGRRTRLSNRDVERVIEALVDVWTEELVRGGRIEIEHFLVLDVQTVERHRDDPFLHQRARRVRLRISRALREKINCTD